ncbi:MAG: hypothetical protein PVI59_00030 [Anaerolineae bacterium]
MVKDLTSRLMADMDPHLLSFLETQVDSFIKWDLIRFYYDNPYTTDTAENISRYTGRTIEKTQDALRELVTQGILISQRMDGLEVYSLSDVPDVRELVRRFFDACEDRHFRTKAIYHVIRSMR